MAPKKHSATTPKTSNPTLLDIPVVLNEQALADLRYLEPVRARDRVISCLNELFRRMQAMEHMHEGPTNEAEPRSKS